MESNLSMDDFIFNELSIFNPVVKLQRLKAVIKCPACSELFGHDDLCAEHLLSICIRFFSNYEEESRRSVLEWIFHYFRTNSLDQQNPSNGDKIDSLLKTEGIDSSLKSRLRVNIPALPETISCPVCHKFYPDAETCSNHLFHECTYSDDYEPLRVQTWLTEYFSSKSENSLAVLKNTLAQYSSSEFICKYCKTKADNEKDLMDHFQIAHPFNENLEQAVCVVCNFSALNETKLFTHMLGKHIRCLLCGYRPKRDSADFFCLKHHVNLCPRNVERLVQCPVCSQSLPVDSELVFKGHILNCKKRGDEPVFSNLSLFGKCDICKDDILLCDIDSHLLFHLKSGDCPARRQKRLRISHDQLNEYS